MNGPGETPPAWQLPQGVNASLWRYTHDEELARDESRYFRDHPLHRADWDYLRTHFREPGRLVDLGCGTGRLSLAFARAGFEVMAVDLSAPMLRVLHEQARLERLPVQPLQANLCRLSTIPDGTFDYALSMFSTLGMIRRRQARATALAETARILKPGGRLALHAHSPWINTRTPEGWGWLATQCVKSVLNRDDAWDRRMYYRGIPDMEVHLFRWGELRRALRGAGLEIEQVRPIDPVTAQPIRLPRLAHPWRAGGWIVLAHLP